MRLPLFSLRRLSPTRLRRPYRCLRNDEGAAAIEFAIVAIPFFMFVMGTIGVGLYFFTTNALEHGVESASRKIRTGEAQKGSLTVGDFKELVCGAAGSYIDCDKLSVLVQNAPTWSDLDPQPCVDGDGMAAATGSPGDVIADYTGGASSVVLVTLCYQWDLAQSFDFLKLGAGPAGSGAAVLQAATAFRVEPYS
jgi:hypothetical protein